MYQIQNQNARNSGTKILISHIPRGDMLPAHSKLDMSLERSMVRSAASVLMKATSHSGTSGCHVMAGISAQNSSKFVTLICHVVEHLVWVAAVKTAREADARCVTSLERVWTPLTDLAALIRSSTSLASDAVSCEILSARLFVWSLS